MTRPAFQTSTLVEIGVVGLLFAACVGAITVISSLFGQTAIQAALILTGLLLACNMIILFFAGDVQFRGFNHTVNICLYLLIIALCLFFAIALFALVTAFVNLLGRPFSYSI